MNTILTDTHTILLPYLQRKSNAVPPREKHSGLFRTLVLLLRLLPFLPQGGNRSIVRVRPGSREPSPESPSPVRAPGNPVSNTRGCFLSRKNQKSWGRASFHKGRVQHGRADRTTDAFGISSQHLLIENEVRFGLHNCIVVARRNYLSNKSRNVTFSMV